MARPSKEEAKQGVRMFVCTESFATEDGVVQRGQRVPEDSPVYRGREHFFRFDGYAAEVEQMTAAPGEHREVIW